MNSPKMVMIVSLMGMSIMPKMRSATCAMFARSLRMCVRISG